MQLRRGRCDLSTFDSCFKLTLKRQREMERDAEYSNMVETRIDFVKKEYAKKKLGNILQVAKNSKTADFLLTTPHI